MIHAIAVGVLYLLVSKTKSEKNESSQIDMPCFAVCVVVARSLLYLWRNLQVYYDLGDELPSAQLYLSSKSKQQTHICFTNTAQPVKILYHLTQSVPVVVVGGSVLVPVLPVLGLERWNHLTLH